MARKIVLATRPESEAHTLAFSNFMKNHRRCRTLTLSVFYIHPLGRSRELRPRVDCATGVAHRDVKLENFLLTEGLLPQVDHIGAQEPWKKRC